MRRSLPVALLAGAAICCLLALTHRAGPALSAAGPSPPAPATPVLSARRVPGPVAGLVADQKLAAQLDAIVGEAGGPAESCLQVQVGATPVYARTPTRLLLPASNVKLLTAWAAITRLGADHVFTTKVMAAKPPANGVVDGPLVLVGGADPILATADYRPSQTEWTLASEPVTKLEALADRVKAAGVTRVNGGVIGDDSRFDGQRTVPTWKSLYLTDGEIGPVGALEVNGGFTVSGRRKAPDANPAASAAATFASLLQARGVAVQGPTGAGTAPSGAVPVASMDSPPLRDVVGIMLRESDNLAAEMLVKELGREFGGAGTWPAGLGVIRDTLAAAKLPTDGLALVDGSGLDRSDRASCATLGALEAAPGPATAIVASALPRAGSCGTLAKRFLGQPAAGRIRAKTGSLTGVAALTGYVDTAPAKPPPSCPPATASAGAGTGPPPGQPISFSLLVNGLATDSAGVGVEDRVADALTTYPQLPAVESFGP